MRSASRRQLVGAASLVALAGCGVLPGVRGTDGSATPAPSAGPGRDTPATLTDPAAALVGAWPAAGAESFRAVFAPGRSSQGLAERLLQAWGELPEVALAAVGGDVVQVSWRAGAETRAAAHRLRVLARDDLVGDLVAEGPLPLWLRAPIRVSERSGAVLVTPRDTEASARQFWLGAAAAAADRLAAARLGPVAAAWDGHLVVEVPAGLLDFSAMVSLPGQDLSGTAAVTRMDAVDSGPRIVVNPQATAEASLAAASDLLAHEGVHAATRSPWLTAPLWAVEGLAESVGAAPGGEQARRNESLARGAVRRAGVPTTLPADEAFAGSGVAVEEAYALAEVAVEACFAQFGRTTFLGWVADWDDPGRAADAELTAAFVAAARRLA